jgi:hypothetical protein
MPEVTAPFVKYVLGSLILGRQLRSPAVECDATVDVLPPRTRPSKACPDEEER